jgi:putative methionine-R-sulfoxide reductase with GAF domain
MTPNTTAPHAATTIKPTPMRNYGPLLARALSQGTREARMIAACDLLWDAFSTQGLSWIGFYLHAPGGPEGQELILGPRRDKPACSPIGLHGCCGRSFRDARALLVGDVATLGANYIACDPRDKSEVVIPLMERVASGLRCWAVLDADSHDTDSFGPSDVRGLTQLMLNFDLTIARDPEPPTLVL